VAAAAAAAWGDVDAWTRALERAVRAAADAAMASPGPGRRPAQIVLGPAADRDRGFTQLRYG
jgi:hypothetical protein